MSNQQNDIFYESLEEAKEELQNKLKDIVNKELIKMIQAVSDWQAIEETLRDYRNGLLPKEQMEQKVALYMGFIKNRIKDTKKVREELQQLK
jgi:hypothetical protein